jgi:thioredoxin reductase (NADPH)
MQRKQIVVDTEKFQTSQPGIFAVGDINTYPGKQKLILCGFHEATLAAHAALAIISPGSERPLQYSTSDTRLQQLIADSR